MIRINLLPKRKAKRRAPVKGEQSVAIGFGVILAMIAGLYLGDYQRINDKADAQKKTNKKLDQQNAEIKEKIATFDKLKMAKEAAEKKKAAIDQLMKARVTPAWFLNELARVVTRDKQPTITTEMQEKLKKNKNLLWQDTWDPKHVWITSIVEEKGSFTLKGAAQSDGDVTQLSHRLAASVFFDSVYQQRSEQQIDRTTGISYFTFVINGKVRY